MANEATIVEEYSLSPMYTIADTGFEMGTWMAMTDPRTVAAHSSANQPVAGVLRVEKISGDGCTQQAVLKYGRVKAKISGSVTVGDALVLAAEANMLKTCPNYNTISGANIAGIAEETGTTGETIFVWLDPYAVRYS
jgi:hypothetical protein